MSAVYLNVVCGADLFVKACSSLSLPPFLSHPVTLSQCDGETEREKTKHNKNYKWTKKAIPRIKKRIGKTERSRRRDEEWAESGRERG